ncbi:hypothetical protein KQ247_10715 [Ruegeria pomeroyi]|nr:hypothetical protein [Ruegeria pomeroyi]NVK98585.1 hypothetical protein [Ruegeria pomeroyi]NVL01782.1 hypothetical protein [Ruegeria pomeroyi]QWV07320.1 hypothetical protein KQ247_10715 [Ruegeria pomeroyi]
MSTETFHAELANYLGVGDLRSDYPDGGWSWNRHRLTLGRYRVELTQDRQIVAQRPRGGGLIPSTQLAISGVRSFAEGERVSDDLCRLLSLAAQSQVVPLSYRFGGRGRQPLHPMGQAIYLRPLLPIRDGAAMRTYLETVWPPCYPAQRDRAFRPVPSPYESLRDHHDRRKEILHEYLLRLLDYRGRMLLYRHAARVGKDIG